MGPHSRHQLLPSVHSRRLQHDPARYLSDPTKDGQGG